MSIEMIGIDHHAAEIDIRTIFSFTKKDMEALLEQMTAMPGINGCVMINTCNRMELWVSASEEWTGDLYGELCAIREVPADIYREYFMSMREQEAVCHLFRLSSGLESRILGEDQILTQVGDALAYARQHYTTDNVLETLFREAVTAGKRARTEVVLSPVDQSVVHTMIRDLKSEGMTFSGKRALVIGNGAMGKLAAVQLKKEGADVTMTVRSFHSGIVDIPAGCGRIDYERRMDLFGQCDYVVSATVSPNYTLPREVVEPAVTGSMVLVDLAVPRDIDPAVRDLDGIRLLDVDSFKEEAYSEEQKQAISEVEEILREQAEEFYSWYNCLDVMPLIQNLKTEIADDLAPRLTKQLRDLPIDPDARKQLDQEIRGAAERTANKMLFGLRDGLNPQELRTCLYCLEELYKK